MKKVLRQVARELAFAIIAIAAFSVLFILGHLALYQSWPRWK